jgi:hypothetical protein
LSGFRLEEHVRRMAMASGAASRLVTQAQGFLNGATIIEPAVHHD